MTKGVCVEILASLVERRVESLNMRIPVEEFR